MDHHHTHTMAKKVVKKSPNKSKSPNLVIPILSVSVLATLGIALYLNVPDQFPSASTKSQILPCV